MSNYKIKRFLGKAINNYVILQPFFFPVAMSHGIRNVRIINKCTIISEFQRFFYCRVPKSANSTVMATLALATTGQRVSTRDGIRLAKSALFKRASGTRVTRAVILRDFFKFTVVRHPHARAVSAFNDKIIDASGYQEVVKNRVTSAVHDPRPLTDIFDGVLDQLETRGRLYRNYHFTPQTELMAFQPHELDYIGRVETLEADLDHITASIFGTPREIVTWSPHGTRNGIRPRDRRMHVDMLSARQKERLNQIYRRDFELLGYDAA